MPYLDKEQQRKYNREWRQKRRDSWFKGKSCVRCGSFERLELDHIDPATKVHHAIWSWRWERIYEEVAKCQVLCRKCHQEKHFQPKTEHGSAAWYNHRACRCDLCKAWHRETARKYRERLRSLKL